MSSGVELRLAGVGDAEALAGINVRAWHHAYVDLIDPRELAERTVESQIVRWQARLGGDRVAGTAATEETCVAVVAGRVAAYATVGLSGDADAALGTGSLLGLYVDPPAQGAGLGDLVHQHAAGWLAERHEAATLWVFAAYGLARGFYERRGWSPDPTGAGQEDPAWRSPAVRYRRDF